MTKAKGTAKEDDEEEFDEERCDLDADENDENQGPIQTKLVSGFIRMWPRAIFHTPLGSGRGSIAHSIEELGKSGVYILYRDDVPFYVGQAKKLRSRLRHHANGLISSKTYFWNYFSAFLVDESNLGEVEAILISSMPSVISNSSKPMIKRGPISDPTKKLLRELRQKGQY